MVLFLIWLIGVAFILMIKGIRYYRIKKLLFQFCIPANPDILKQEMAYCINRFDNSYSRLNYSVFTQSSKINLFTCSVISSPMTIGIFKPAILLPEEVYPDKGLHFILRHELIHIYRKDSFIKLIGLMVLIFNWYNPFGYVLAKQLDNSRHSKGGSGI